MALPKWECKKTGCRATNEYGAQFCSNCGERGKEDYEVEGRDLIRKEKVQIYKDEKDGFVDFTIVIGQDVVFMNDTPNHPQFGVNQYAGDISEYDRKRFGKRISLKSVPLEVKKAIKQRLR